MQALFLDAGGTLFDPRPSVGHIYAQIALKHGGSETPEHVQRKFGKEFMRRDGIAGLVSHADAALERRWWRELVRDVVSSVPEQRFDAFYNELYDYFGHAHAWHLYPDVIPTLEELSGRGVILGIISNWDSRLQILCDDLHISGYFDFILASAVEGCAKPCADIFHSALSRAGVEPGEALHVGDSPASDVAGAQAVGINPVLIHRHGTPPRIDVPVITSLDQLLSWT